MTARSLRVPRFGAHVAAAPPKRGPTYLGLRVSAAFGVLVAMLAALTLLGAFQMQGAAAVVAVGLGMAAIVLSVAIAAWLLRSMVRPLGPVTRAVARLSAGDLNADIDLAAAGELLPLVQAVHEVREKLLNVVGQVRTGTGNVALNAAQIARDNEALSQRTDTQADSLQETAASMEELTAAVRQNAGTAQQAHALVQAATVRAEQGGAVMREVVETMGAIRASSYSIREIIGVIDGIAFQTNILALNAAVEAARAGEQGRGFAVVAGEVRSLAQRSAEAAREIKGLIGASVDKVDTGGGRVDQAGQAMAEIVAAVRQVAQLISQINGASREQSSGIETINTAIARIESTTQDNASFVKGAARTAAALQERAVTLMQSVAGFSLGDREHGTVQEAVALVDRGCAFLRAHGRAALLQDVNSLDAGRFVDRDLYLMVLDKGAVFIAHGSNPGRLGTGPTVKDVEGKLFARELARAAFERGEGWVDYKWVHPVSQEVFTKSAYVRREGDIAIFAAATKA